MDYIIDNINNVSQHQPEQNLQDQRKAEESTRFYHQLWQKANDINQWATSEINNNNAPIQPLKTMIQQLENGEGAFLWDTIIQSLKMEDSLILNVFMPRANYDMLTDHATNVAILSLRLGLSTELYSHGKLIQLGTAALVHDLGMAGIQKSILSQSANLSEEQTEEFMRHIPLGTKILSKLGEEYDWLTTICSQEHERENGQGFPAGLAQDQIHHMSKIIGLTDTLESMTHPPWEMSPMDAIQTLITTQKKLFSASLLKILLKELSPFPPGTYVRLNSKEIGQIIEISKGHPLRPSLKIIFDASGIPLKNPKIVHLKSKPLLYIVGSVKKSMFHSI
ncbi:MAG: HD-GYP domain-containing protein [bacterium]